MLEFIRCEQIVQHDTLLLSRTHNNVLETKSSTLATAFNIKYFATYELVMKGFIICKLKGNFYKGISARITMKH